MSETARSASALRFEDVLPSLRRAAEGAWVVGRGLWTDPAEDHYHYSALIPKGQVAPALARPDWDLQPGSAKPSVWSTGDEVHAYYRLGDRDGIEPIVIVRSFNGIKPVFPELLEEYRLFHNLYFDDATNRYVRFDDAGAPSDVAKLDGDRLELLLRPIRQFLAWKDASLALFVVWNRYETKTLEELGLREQRGVTVRDATSIFSHTITKCDWKAGFQSFARLLGKVVIPPLSREQSGWGPYEEEPRYSSFIVGVDRDGAPVEISCAPESSEDCFLAPVWFRSEVLKKYQDDPDRYVVGDGLLVCEGLWDLPIDNDHAAVVAVFLGDLRHIPESEQLHWRAHNIVHSGELSETAVSRSFRAEWATSESPEHTFVRSYASFMDFSEKTIRAFLIRPLGDGDSHCLKTVHVPHTENAMEFDHEVLKLTKLLVDSLNDKELEKHITVEKEDKSLTKLEKYLVVKGRADYTPHLGFLRSLQRYRSTNAAHRRGSDAKKAFDALGAGGAGAKSRRDVFAVLLQSATSFLEYMVAVHAPAIPAPAASTKIAGS